MQRGQDEPDWDSDWMTEAASGVQGSCSWPPGLRTHRTGSVESTHKLGRNQTGWMKTEGKKKEK